MKEPGLDGRHRDKNGKIDRKRKDTSVRALRKTYGKGFLASFRGDATLGSVTKKMGVPALKKLIKKSR